MSGFSTKVVCAFLLFGLALSSGCLGGKAEAATSIKYVCGDGSIVSESRECRTEEKACICNQTCSAPKAIPGIPENQTTLPIILETPLSVPVSENSSGPCESMGCPADALFVGNSETKKFHTCDCAQGARISPKKRVCFVSAKYAVSLGYVPCGFCKPSDKPKT